MIAKNKKAIGFIFLNDLDLKNIKLYDLIKSFNRYGMKTKGVYFKSNLGLKIYVESKEGK